MYRTSSLLQPLNFGAFHQILNPSTFESNMDTTSPESETGENPLQRRCILRDELEITEKLITEQFGCLVQRVSGISDAGSDQYPRFKGSATLELSSSSSAINQFLPHADESLASSGLYKILITFFYKSKNTTSQYEDVVAKVAHVVNKRFSIQLGKQWTALIQESEGGFVFPSNSDKESEVEVYVKCLESKPIPRMKVVLERGIDLPITHKLKPDGSSLVSIPRWAMEIMNRLPNSNRVKDNHVRYKFYPIKEFTDGYEDEYRSTMQQMYWRLSHGQFVSDGRHRNYAFQEYGALFEAGKTYMAKLEIEPELSDQELYDKMLLAGTIHEQEWAWFYKYTNKEDQLRAQFEQLMTPSKEEVEDFMRKVDSYLNGYGHWH